MEYYPIGYSERKMSFGYSLEMSFLIFSDGISSGYPLENIQMDIISEGAITFKYRKEYPEIS
jgi:hypothetical protein